MRIFLIGMAVLTLGACMPPSTPTSTLYIGTYTGAGSEGIYTVQFNSQTGELSEYRLKAEVNNPSYLAFSDSGDKLYAVQETDDFNASGGGISVFDIQGDSLILQQEAATSGAHPCHVALSKDYVGVANYTGGNVALYKLSDDGHLIQPTIIDHKVLDATKAAHAHKVVFRGNQLFVADLGLDLIRMYQNDGLENWVASGQESISLPDGAGPRHFVFSASGSRMYVLNELNATVTVLENHKDGHYKAIQTENTLDPSWEGVKSCAHIQFSPEERFLYVSNRGENTIVCYKVNPADGKLTFVSRTSVEGDWPRNFTLDPSGKFLLVANQKSNNIVVFKRDIEQGGLTYLNQMVLSQPVCLLFKP